MKASDPSVRLVVVMACIIDVQPTNLLMGQNL